MVPTQVAAAGAPAIPIDYKLYQDGGGDWRVYDVVIDGISLVSTYRNNFNSQIGRVGIDGVIESMKQRAEGATP
jgi:phospholipid transport system substrate-binding protein